MFQLLQRRMEKIRDQTIDLIGFRINASDRCPCFLILRRQPHHFRHGLDGCNRGSNIMGKLGDEFFSRVDSLGLPQFTTRQFIAHDVECLGKSAEHVSPIHP